MERKELGLELERLADRFSEGWHEGIKIDALDIVLLIEAAQALAQPAQRTWVGLSNGEMIKLSELPLGNWDLILEVEAALKSKNT